MNLNSDLVQQQPDFAWRVTADEVAIGRGHVAKFRDVETKTPGILTTSQLLTTGLNAPTCKNVVVQTAKARGYRSSHNLKAMVYLVAGKLEMLPFA